MYPEQQPQPGQQPYPGQQYPAQPAQQAYPGQPSYPGQQPGQPGYPGQPAYPGQQAYPGQPAPDQPYSGQPAPDQPYSGQPYSGQPAGYPGADPSVWGGSPAPVSGPQVSPAYTGQPGLGYPTTDPYAATTAGGYPSAAPAPQRARRSTPLIVLVLVLAVALVGTLIAVLVTSRGLSGEVRELRAERVAQKATVAAATNALQEEFKRADLAGKLARVQDLSEKAVQALLDWDKSVETLKIVQEARNQCFAAIVDYDATAARFPTDMLTGYPARIDVTDEDTNCGQFNT